MKHSVRVRFIKTPFMCIGLQVPRMFLERNLAHFAYRFTLTLCLLFFSFILIRELLVPTPTKSGTRCCLLSPEFVPHFVVHDTLCSAGPYCVTDVVVVTLPMPIRLYRHERLYIARG